MVEKDPVQAMKLHVIQGDQLNMSVFFWYLAKSVTSEMYVYSTPMKSLNCSHIVRRFLNEMKDNLSVKSRFVVLLIDRLALIYRLSYSKNWGSEP